jgi:DNA modification methylase
MSKWMRSIASGFCTKCGAWRGSLGLEPDYELYLDHLVTIFNEVRSVLKTTGTLWVNLGDTYAGSWGNYGQSKLTQQRREDGSSSSWHRRGYDDTNFRPPAFFSQPVPRRSLCQIPSRFAIRMAEQGWILRNDIIWHKPNHMPSSVKNRFACSWEHLLFFTKTEKYYFDLNAVRMPHKTIKDHQKRWGPHARLRISPNIMGVRRCPNPGEPGAFHPKGKNPGDFWTIPSETRRLGAILGSSGVVKVPGGAGWTGHPPGGQARIIREKDPRWLSPQGKNPGDVWEIITTPFKGAHFAVYPEALCERPIKAGCPPEGLVLDPFVGAGTTAVVAKRLGRRFIGFELNPNYVRLARERLTVPKRSRPKQTPREQMNSGKRRLDHLNQ